MNKHYKIEMLYSQQKKSMTVAYILGFLLGGVGLQYFYAKRPDLGCISLALFFLSFTGSFTTVIFVGWVLVSFVLTYYVVDDTNKKIKQNIELMVGE